MAETDASTCARRDRGRPGRHAHGRQRRRLARPTTFGGLPCLPRELLPELEQGDGRPRPHRQAARVRGRRRPRRVPGDVDARARRGARGSDTSTSGGSGTLPYPTLAAVDGAASAGASRSRCTATTAPSRPPSATSASPGGLGIVPAWGGSQLAPRLVGAKARSSYVTNPLRQRRLIDAGAGAEIGLAEQSVAVSRVPRRRVAWLAVKIAGGGAASLDARPRRDAAEAAAGALPGRRPGPRRGHAPGSRIQRIAGAAGGRSRRATAAEEDALADCCPAPRPRRRSRPMAWSSGGG